MTAAAVHGSTGLRPSHAIRAAATYLAERGLDRPLPAAEIILRHVLGTDRAGVYARGAPLLPEEAAAFDAAVLAIGAGVPLQYVTGDQPFRALDLAVRNGVFIPRPETEMLVELGLELIERRPRPVVVDVGTGSGAIALAIAERRPDAEVAATDVSRAAVALARENADRLRIEIDVRAGDLLEPMEKLRGRIDLVVSNPPYVDGADLDRLPANVRAEPRTALAGGVDLHRRLVRQADAALTPGGWIAMEVAPTQASTIAAALERRFPEVRVVADLTGRHRFVVGRRS
jgi:release factor glutamine methyltransferase